MEFGPRALGARSILGDARSPAMQSSLNLKIKFREAFVPSPPPCCARTSPTGSTSTTTAPTCCWSPTCSRRRRPASPGDDRLFGIDKLNVPRSDIPAVTHVDYSARVQTVHADTNPRFHDLLTAFKAETGCPVLVNTSFNVRGEPIVCTPEDAFRCFMGTDIEVLVVGNCFLGKEDQPSSLKLDYKNMFDLD